MSNILNKKRKHLQSLTIIDDTVNQIIGMFQDKVFRKNIIMELIIDNIGYYLLPIYETKLFHKMFGITHFDYRRYKFSHYYEYATIDNWDVRIKCQLPPILSGPSYINSPIEEIFNKLKHPDKNRQYIKYYDEEGNPYVLYPNNISLGVTCYNGEKYPQIVFTNPQPYINIIVRATLNHKFMDVLKEINLLKSNTSYMDGDLFVLIVGRYAPKGNLPFDKITDIFAHCGISIIIKKID